MTDNTRTADRGILSSTASLFPAHTTITPFVLHGPPGVGKSSLVIELSKLMGAAAPGEWGSSGGAIDLETVQTGDDRERAFNDLCALCRRHPPTGQPGPINTRTLFIGAAQYGRQLRSIPAWHILLLPRPRMYYARRVARDRAVPRKAAQLDWYPAYLGLQEQQMISPPAEAWLSKLERLYDDALAYHIRKRKYDYVAGLATNIDTEAAGIRAFSIAAIAFRGMPGRRLSLVGTKGA